MNGQFLPSMSVPPWQTGPNDPLHRCIVDPQAQSQTFVHVLCILAESLGPNTLSGRCSINVC